MKNWLAGLVLLLSLTGCVAPPVNPYAHAHAVAVHIEMVDSGTCSGTVIGPHAILSAAHCFTEPYTAVLVDDSPVTPTDFIADGHDHVIVVVKQTFPDWADVGPAPVQCDEVYTFGGPLGGRDMFRVGHVAGSDKTDPDGTMLIDLNNAPGDSGAGIFNTHGQLVGVISYYVGMAGFHLTGINPLAFTPDQIAKAAA